MSTTKEEIERASGVLKRGGIILYPTDTVWGLGCDATNTEAVSQIFKIKQRAECKALVTLVCDLNMLDKYVLEIPTVALNLIEVNDAPMTIIYPNAVGLSPNVIAEGGTAAIRIPMSPFCRELISRFGKPVVSTSANISGEMYPETFEEISHSIKNSADYVVDPSVEERTATHRPSQIIQVGPKGEVKIIRG